jgi:hypothetical protein
MLRQRSERNSAPAAGRPLSAAAGAAARRGWAPAAGARAARGPPRGPPRGRRAPARGGRGRGARRRGARGRGARRRLRPRAARAGGGREASGRERGEGGARGRGAAAAHTMRPTPDGREAPGAPRRAPPGPRRRRAAPRVVRGGGWFGWRAGRGRHYTGRVPRTVVRCMSRVYCGSVPVPLWSTAGVVPQHEVSGGPAVPVEQVGTFEMRAKGLEQLLLLPRCHADDLPLVDHQVDVQRPASGDRMGPDHGMDEVVRVNHAGAVDLVLDRLRQRLVGGVGVREEGVPGLGGAAERRTAARCSAARRRRGRPCASTRPRSPRSS